MKNSSTEQSPQPQICSNVSRREFLSTAARGLGAAAVLSSLPADWVGGAYAGEGPETPDLKFGIIALTDCSPIVIAHEKSFFKKYGINSTVLKGANWAAIRDSLSNGDIQATHMLIGMPLASTMGLLGSPKKPTIVPWLINRNGQSITKWIIPLREERRVMGVPIVSIPARIEAGLVPYRDLFPRPETYQHIKEYCTGRVVLEKPSINRLAACLVDGPAQSSINKALTRSPWSGEAVNQRRLERIQKHHRGNGLRIGIIDSTFSHPPRGEKKI
jgi:hypothetical protein